MCVLHAEVCCQVLPLLCSTLSSVEPPNVWLDLKLPSDVISEGNLSALQLEAVVYACQQHMNILGNSARAGYLVGKCSYLLKEGETVLCVYAMSHVFSACMCLPCPVQV